MTARLEHTTCHHASYRLSCDDFERLLDRAADQCEICGIASDEAVGGRLQIDHDHGKGNGFNHIRGMLCSKCNANLKYAERGEREATPAERRYLDNAWYIDNPPRPPKPGTDVVRLSFALPRALRTEFNSTVRPGSDRDRMLADLLRWYLREPGANAPKRPPRPNPKTSPESP